jgi:signal transduction histidine kinase/sugar lactone lactonase YvrE
MRYRITTFLQAALCALLAATLCQAAVPADPAVKFSAATSPLGLSHSSWTTKDGGPAYVAVLAQSPDGWLWVGSSTGLFRFDGERFERFPGLLSSNISGLKVLPSGALWVGYRYSGATEIKDGKIVKHYSFSGLAAGSAMDFGTDGKGRIWAATAGGLFLLKDGKFAAAPAEMKAPTAIYQILNDKQGAMWLRTENGIYRIGADEAVCKLVQPWGWGYMVEAEDGSIWGSDGTRGGINLLQPPGDGKPTADWRTFKGSNSYLAFDKSGRLWTAREDGVEMLEPGAGEHVAHHFGREQGLTGNSGTALLVDREGNIWIGTGGGLDRFRDNKVNRYAYGGLPALGEALALGVASDGAVWTDHFLLPDPATAPVRYDPSPPTSENEMIALYVDPQGVQWSASSEGLARTEKKGAGFIRTAIPLPHLKEEIYVHDMSMDREGALWVTVGKTLYRWKDGKWEKGSGYRELDDIAYGTIYTAGDGTLWFGAGHNELRSLNNGKPRIYDNADGLHIGAVMQMLSDGKYLWIGGENGLALYDGTRFQMVVGQGGETFLSTAGLVKTPSGDLWLNSGTGVFHIAAAELRKLQATPSYRVPFEHLGYEDGLRGTAPQRSGYHAAVLAKGKIWFGTTEGLYWVDPDKMLRNKLVPAVAIQRIAAGAAMYSRNDGLTLPQGTRELHIDYTALSLTMPERMQFQYKLDGVDTEWKAVGDRRSAYYTNLAPGSYRFHVKAANNDGVWNERGDSTEFSIAPTLFETGWFRAACAAVALACAWLLTWLLYRLRLRQMGARMQETLNTRFDERERIARELHDTLLQSVQGLVLKVHGVAMRLPTGDAARGMLDAALAQAEQTIVEARDRVRGLRNRVGGIGLQDLLRGVALELSGPGAPRCEVSSSCEPRALAPDVANEVFAIGREALLNAYQHAGASHVAVRIETAATELRLSVSDDGAGIPEDILHSGGRAGHWGLTGMRERAARLGAALMLRRQPHGGTECVLTLPAERAYLAPPSTE